MKIKTIELTKQKDKLEFHYHKDFNYLAKEIKQVEEIPSVEISGYANKVAGIIYVKGSIKADLLLECSRCLVKYHHILETKFDEVYIPQNVESDLVDAEDDVHLLETDEIDLDPLVEEALILSIPYVPLCKEDCKGLCPTCGVNLNENSCDCKVEKIDPRLADLAKWFDQNDTSE